MAHSAPRLAKLTRPRLHAPIARERLFRLIDELRSRPAVWIEGPPGAGKTTLVATYLDEADPPGIWYQLDGGDSDPATFFYYLRQAAFRFSPRRKPLPLLTPEYLTDLLGFARRFFRDLIARIPPGAVLSFDNYHEIDPDSRLHEIFCAAVDEVPQDANFIIISRASPPAGFARAHACDKMGRVTWDQLRLTQDETRLIARARGDVNGDASTYLFEQSQGWAAGVMLLLERIQRQGKVEAETFADTPESTFDYFASQIFDPEPAETRKLLITAAFLPRVTVALAEAVSGNLAAGKILERLYRRRLFVDRSPGEPPAYQFHSLFRAFLQNRAAAEFGSHRVNVVKLEAARLLLENGFEEDAVTLYAETREWNGLVEIVIAAAPMLIAQGRWQTLAVWIAHLPREVSQANPWIGYWLGRSKMQVDPRLSRALLEEVVCSFEARRDEVGQLLGAVAILEALHFEFEDFHAMDPWIARVAGLIEKGVRPPHPEDELRANAAVLMATTYRAPRSAIRAHCLRQVQDHLSEPYDVNLRVWIAAGLHSYAHVAMDDDAERLATRVGSELLGAPELTPRIALYYLQSAAYTHYLHGRYDPALVLYEKQESIARENGLEEPLRNIWLHRGLCERRMGRLDAVEETIARLQRGGHLVRGQKNAVLTFLKGAVAFDRGRKEEGLRDLVEAVRHFDASGLFSAMVLAGLGAANHAIECGRYDVAERLLERTHTRIAESAADTYEGVLYLLEAWLAHRRSDRSAAERLLGQSLSRARDPRARARYEWYSNALAEMLPVALERDIESQTARELAQDLKVVPASALSVENWPWPVKIYTLGRFELLIDGTPLVFERKAPKKALALLQAIVAFGSRDVPEDRIIDALWPDEEGDAGHRVFNTTLYRLRRLVRDNEVVLQSGGRLTLNSRRCWVDAHAFEQALAAIGDAAQDESARRQALGLYRGAFLADEDGVPWIVPARERLRDKFVHAVRLAGRAAEDSDRYGEAIGWYLRGLDADNLVEVFYQGLMRCYGRLERSAEVTNTYRRLKQALSLSLGARPSAVSEKLYQQSLLPASPPASHP